MQSIPLQPVPSQSTKVVLGGQNCQLLVYQKPQGVFVDINADGVDIVVGIIGRDAVPLVCREYTGFIGNIFGGKGIVSCNHHCFNSHFPQTLESLLYSGDRKSVV